MAWSVVSFLLGQWSGQWSALWSVVSAGGSQCFAFSLVGGRFLFSKMVCGHCLNQYMVSGQCITVVGPWLVGHSGITPGLQLEPSHERLHAWTNSKIWNKNDSLVLHESI